MANSGKGLFGRRNRRERERAKERREIARSSAMRRTARVGKALLVFLVLLLSVVPVLFVNNAIAWVPFIAVVLLFVVDVAYVAVLARSLSFDEGSVGSSCLRGGKASLNVGFTNKSFLAFPRIEVTFYVADLLEVSVSEHVATTVLLPKEARDFAFDARFKHLGEYTAGVSKVVVFDLVGLFGKTIQNPERHKVSVMPRLFDPGAVELSEVSLRESSKRYKPVVDDSMDYTGVRDYAYGDPLKFVHWKLSSRMQGAELYTRVFEVYGNPGMEIIVDPYAPSYEPEDLLHVYDGLIESALSLCDYGRGLGLDVELAYLSKDEGPAKMPASRDSASELMNRMMPVRSATSTPESMDACELLLREGRSSHGMENMVMVTSRLDEGILSALVNLKMRRRNPLLVVVVPRSVEDEERDEFLRPLRRLAAAGISFYVVESTEESTEVVSA